MSVFCIRLTRNGFNDKQLSEISLQYIKFEKLSLKKSITFFAGAIGDDEYFYKNKVLKSSCDLQLKFASI
ncbi:hypothetical protein T05_8097 [Trichinella murrelli]|uniref:Uncharacterized protein n=1 Tax=Trichinella murrelli TaxID=144512 RepID=A0A0V0TW34_9BILA|nr:hypothetical protein T05_8097 [Trichinella murrelli]